MPHTSLRNYKRKKNQLSLSLSLFLSFITLSALLLSPSLFLSFITLLHSCFVISFFLPIFFRFFLFFYFMLFPISLFVFILCLSFFFFFPRLLLSTNHIFLIFPSDVTLLAHLASFSRLPHVSSCSLASIS